MIGLCGRHPQTARHWASVNALRHLHTCGRSPANPAGVFGAGSWLPRVRVVRWTCPFLHSCHHFFPKPPRGWRTRPFMGHDWCTKGGGLRASARQKPRCRLIALSAGCFSLVIMFHQAPVSLWRVCKKQERQVLPDLFASTILLETKNKRIRGWREGKDIQEEAQKARRGRWYILQQMNARSRGE